MTLALAMVLPQAAQAYDFSKYTSTGQLLFYSVTSDSTVKVTYPGSSTSNPYENAVKPANSMTIPESVTNNGITYTVNEIDTYAFYRCSNLTYVYIPNSVTTIGQMAFYYCTGMTSVRLPENLTVIPNYAFYYCSALMGYLSLPSSVTFIGYCAFAGCSTLGGVGIPANVTYIHMNAFSNCTSLTTVNFDATNCTYMGGLSNNGSVITAFSGCTNLHTIHINQGVQNIPAYAFYGCTSWTENALSLPNSLTSIGDYAFYGCSGLSGYLVLPGWLTSIGEHAFQSCYNFTGDLYIPNSVTSIGTGAFNNCFGFNGTLHLPVNLTSIPSTAFANCSNLTGTLTLPNGLTTIGMNAFYHCHGLSGTLTIPASMTTIGYSSLSNCTNLEAINFASRSANQPLQILGWAFEDCTGLEGPLTLPEGLTRIEEYAFYNCTNLYGPVTIPSTVTQLYDYAFGNCSVMRNVRMEGTNPPSLGLDVFYNTPSYMTITVPCGSKSAYQQAWGNNYNIVGGTLDSVEIVTACDSYTWPRNGQTYYETYDEENPISVYNYNEEENCFFVESLILTINHSQRSHEYVTNCGPYTWDLTGQTYNKSGLKFHKGTTQSGCPIRDTLELTIIDRYHSYTEVENCGPYTWDKTGQTYNKSGLKFYKGTADDGCPIRDTLKLTVTDRIHSYTEVTSCGPYTWQLTGQTYNKSGLKFNKGTTPDGCLIRDTLKLTVTDRIHSYTEVTNCGPYTWDVTGQTYNKSGLKFNKGVTSDGCLIRDTLKLTVVDRWSSHDTVVSCDGTYTWDKTGQTYKKTGMKFFKGTANDGCPIRDTLYVIISQKEHSYTEVTNCGPYTWDLTGQTYNKSGLKFNKTTNEYGCPVRDTLMLTIISCKGQEFDATEENAEFILNSQFSTLNSLKVYPNPTTGRVQLNVTEAEKIEVLDLVGRRVAMFENTNTLDLSGLADGTYTLRVTMPEGVAIRKVVKR